MAGGAWDNVMGAMYNEDNSTIKVSSGGFDQSVIDSPAMNKYIDKYAHGMTKYDQAAYNRRLLGDATGEVQNWNGDYTWMVCDTASWIRRGGMYGETVGSGIFYSLHAIGIHASSDSFRIVVSAS